MSIDTKVDENADHLFELYGMPFVMSKRQAQDGLPGCRVGLASLK